MELMHTLQAAGVPAMPVLSSADVLNDPHMQARDYFQRTTRAEIGPHAHGLHWAHFSETPLSLRRPAPLLGEHNTFVLKELLGLSDAQLSDLERAKVIGTTFVGSARL
ncbi:MAG: CoA transferase [Desulfurellaceae bacterium]|nr:CoA transferase [Desulfurellaceae bacterium]